MKVLSIGLDKRALNTESSTGKRIKEYASLVEKLELIILGAESNNKAISFFRAIKKADKILSEDSSGWLITTQDPFFTGLAGYWLKRKHKIPLQIQVHIDFFSPYFWRESIKNKINVILARFLLPKADCIRVVSGKIKEYLVTNFKIDKSKIVLLPIRTEIEQIIKAEPVINLHTKYPQFDFIILAASRLVKQKNLGIAISAMKEICKKYPRTGLIIVGSGPEEKRLKYLAKSMENVIFEPWTEDIISYYKTSDLFILPSYYEGWGRTVVEAMAAKCPVIMTNVGLANELLISGYNGIVIPVDDKKALIESILSIIETPGLKEKITTNAFLTVNSLETKEQYLEKYLKSWQNC